MTGARPAAPGRGPALARACLRAGVLLALVLSGPRGWCGAAPGDDPDPDPGDDVPAEWVVHAWSDRSLAPAAALGDPNALFIVGRQYMIQAADSDSEEARRLGLEYLDWSARQGFNPADRFLAAIYIDGNGVPRDTARAVTYLERAAGRGDAAAQQRLGDLYFEGTDVVRDFARALHWYGLAFDNPAPGQLADPAWRVGLRLARLHLEAGVPGADPAGARAILRETARRYPVGPALKALAESYARGDGGPPRPRQALETYGDAAADYLDHGLALGIDRDRTRGEALGILAAMERLDPEADATRALRQRLRGDPAAPPPPGAAMAGRAP